MSEKPVHSRPRRLVDWINLMGTKKVHSLIDKVYKRKNLEMAWEKVKANRGSGGVDGQNLEAFEAQLDQQLDRLQRELKEDAYRPQPVRQHPIQKRDKPGEYRMLGIPTIYDRVCQQALLQRLESLFEPVFDAASFGYRRGRSTKDAMRKVWKEIKSGREWIVDADLKDFFDNMSHEWLIQFVEHRIVDRRILRLIQKWLQAGVSEEGEWSETKEGTPQGAVVSPLLANIYLHYAFDLWLEVWRKKVAKGKVMAIRYADDLVVGFERRDEAERFLKEFGERLAKFGLELHPEKTRMIEFGPNAARDRRARREGKPESFTFLGFAHSCGTTRQGYFQIRRQTARKRLEAKLQNIKQTLRSRMHEPVPKVGEWLERVLNGHYQYFGVPGNWASLGLFRERIARYWGRVLGRRSQTGKVSAIRLGRLFRRWLPRPKVGHPYPERRFAVNHPR